MRKLLSLLLMSWVPLGYAQQVYKCVQDNGTTVYSRTPCAEDPAKVEVVDTSRALKVGSGPVDSLDPAVLTASEIGRKAACLREEEAIRKRYVEEFAQIDRRAEDAANRDPALVIELQVRRRELEKTEKAELKQAEKRCKEELARPPEPSVPDVPEPDAGPRSWHCTAENGEEFFRHDACPSSIRVRPPRDPDSGVQSPIYEIDVSAKSVSRSVACKEIDSPDAWSRRGSNRDEKVPKPGEADLCKNP